MLALVCRFESFSGYIRVVLKRQPFSIIGIQNNNSIIEKDENEGPGGFELNRALRVKSRGVVRRDQRVRAILLS